MGFYTLSKRKGSNEIESANPKWNDFRKGIAFFGYLAQKLNIENIWASNYLILLPANFAKIKKLGFFDSLWRYLRF
jgi:hypothetical protein